MPGLRSTESGHTPSGASARGGVTNWDSIYPTPTSVRMDLQWWIDNLSKYNGHCIFPRQGGVVVVAGDNSEAGMLDSLLMGN